MDTDGTLWEMLSALGTLAAAGIAVFSAWQSARAAKASEQTSRAAVEALSAHLLPLVTVSHEHDRVEVRAVGDYPLHDVTVIATRRGEVVGEKHVQVLHAQRSGVVADPGSVKLSVPGGVQGAKESLVTEVTILCSDYRLAGRWRLIAWYDENRPNVAPAWPIRDREFLGAGRPV